MPPHNNAIQRPHLRKHYQKWIRTWFNQPARKLRRITKRRELAQKVFPRPTQALRPSVSKPTFRYTGQLRLGRGFSLQELAEVKINPRFAQSVGIAVDYRRTNKSVESIQRNVARLKAYLAKLVLLPKKAGTPHKGTRGVLSDSTANVEAVQETHPEVTELAAASKRAKAQKIAGDQSAFRAHAYLRLLRMQQKHAGKKAKAAAEAKKDN